MIYYAATIILKRANVARKHCFGVFKNYANSIIKKRFLSNIQEQPLLSHQRQFKRDSWV